MRFYILTLFLLSLTLFPAFGQSGGGERYADIDLYRRWQQNELCDSIYQKSHLKYIADSADHHRFSALAPIIKNKGLWEEYRAIAASEKTGKVENLLSLADRAARKHDSAMELETLSAAFTEAFWRTKDYDKTFFIGFQLEEKLPQVSEAEYPYKRETYYKLGEAYYLMLDFHKSIRLLENALSPAPIAFDDRTNLDALNIMGICYANIGRMDTSDDYFRATLLSADIVLNRPIYNAYALAHLGCNAMLTGQYDKALAISRVAWPVLRRETKDYGHLAGMCYCRGRSHLEKGDFKQASVWIDSLVYFANRDQYNQTKRIKQAHLLRADYYTAIGDARQAKVFNDSLVSIYKREEENYTSGYIARASQKHDGEKIADKEAKLQTFRVRLAVISIVAMLSLAVIGVILSLYRKKNAAYRALAQKADLWAREETVTNTPAAANGETHKGEATNEDRKIMSLVERELTVNYAYRDSELTLESLAQRIGVQRNALSRAINRTADQNFSQYINGYRIKEAVRIIAESNGERLHIGELYERVGFTNRSTFSRTFKQFTGISPVDFQKKSGRIIVIQAFLSLFIRSDYQRNAILLATIV